MSNFEIQCLTDQSQTNIRNLCPTAVPLTGHGPSTRAKIKVITYNKLKRQKKIVLMAMSTISNQNQLLDNRSKVSVHVGRTSVELEESFSSIEVFVTDKCIHGVYPHDVSSPQSNYHACDLPQSKEDLTATSTCASNQHSSVPSEQEYISGDDQHSHADVSHPSNDHAADSSFKETDLVPKICTGSFTEHKVPLVEEITSPQVKKKRKTNGSSSDKQKHRTNILSQETLIQVEGMLQKIVYMDLIRCHTDLSVKRRMKCHTRFLRKSYRAEKAGRSDFTVSKFKKNRKQAKLVHLNENDSSNHQTVKEPSKALDAQGRRTAAKQQIVIARRRSKTTSKKDDQVPSSSNRKTVKENNSKLEAQAKRCHRLFEIARLYQIAAGKRIKTASEDVQVSSSYRKTLKEKNSKFEAQGLRTTDKCCHRLFDIARLEQIAAGKRSQIALKDVQVPSSNRSLALLRTISD